MKLTRTVKYYLNLGQNKLFNGTDCSTDVVSPQGIQDRNLVGINHRLSKDRCVTSVKKLSHGRHLPSKCRSRDYSSFGSTSLPSKMFSTPFLQL